MSILQELFKVEQIVHLEPEYSLNAHFIPPAVLYDGLLSTSTKISRLYRNFLSVIIYKKCCMLFPL